MKNATLLIMMMCCQLVYAQLPVLAIQENNQSRNLQVSKLHASVEVTGNIAVTTYDVLFYNPLPRDLEGELSMALGDNQEISRYALDINGNLREGVIIEKVKARQTFEAIVRQEIDPGITFLTLGNHFKTRIYPVPAKGYKRVVIAVSETLTIEDGNLMYSLPFTENTVIDDFRLHVQVNKGTGEILIPNHRSNNIQFNSTRDAWIMSLERANFTTDKPVQFAIPLLGNNQHQVFTRELDGQTWFYLFAKVPALGPVQKISPSVVTIYWDNSFNALKRDIEKELELLKYYLGSFPSIKVNFVAFQMQAQDVRTFHIEGDVSELVHHIRSLRPDGATRLSSLSLTEAGDEIFLFSDGISNIGNDDWPLSHVPVHTISSAAGSNFNFLKRVASASQGEFINLAVTGPERAADLLNRGEEKFLRCRYDAAEMTSVYPDMPARIHAYLEITGILLKDHAVLHVDYGHGAQVTHTRSYSISKGKDVAMVPRIWASNRISSLSGDATNNKEEIQELGRRFGILTPNTSFIVLDRVEDYVQYDVEPPAELREEYNRLVASRASIAPPAIPQNDTPYRFEKLSQWYIKPMKESGHQQRILNIDVEESQMVEMEEMPIFRQEMPPPPPQRGGGNDVSANLPPPPPAIRERRDESIVLEFVDDEVALEEVMLFSLAESVGDPSSPGSISSVSAVKVLAWLPDAPWMQVLRETEKSKLESVYFSLREEQINRPSFYLQVADYFFSQNMKPQATRILSNLLCLDLENPEMLKVVARRLLDEGEYELAIAIFHKISLLRPEEPQSFRDLAMAYMLSGQYNEALKLYNYILDKNWERFNDLKDVALNELNHLVALHKNQLDKELIPGNYIKPMPFDIRITIDWSTNDNDIDLWVVDPNGEKCMYSNPNTQLGGKISTDFTRGYGPEEFTLKNAKRGTYTVFVDFFSENRQTIAGPVTVYATLSTRYGTAAEQTQRISVQLDRSEHTMQIGQIEFE